MRSIEELFNKIQNMNFSIYESLVNDGIIDVLSCFIGQLY